MKFTDGNWLLRRGVAAHYARQAFRCDRKGDSVEILAPCREVAHLGDTLQGPVLTVRLSSPMENVIKVSIRHFEGGLNRGPHFRVATETVPAEIEIDEARVVLKSGRLSARIDRAAWKVDFEADGRRLTGSPARGMALMDVEGDGPHIQDQLTLQVGETVIGLGERFTAWVKNGQVVDIWHEDGGANSEQAYKNVPFYMTDRGYGIFVNDPGRVSFEVATERVSRVGFSVPGEGLDYYVIYGPSPKEILERYTALTGRPALPPAWSFGLWLSTSFTTQYDEATVMGFLDQMAERDLPLSVFHFDCAWMEAFHWTDLRWNPATFPNPKEMLDRLHERGLKVCVWINPYIAQASRLFEEGKEAGYFVRKPNGDVWQWDMWQPGMALVDFTNPLATDWFTSRLAEVLDMGVDALKTDFGERIPTDVVYYDGSDPVRMHNMYTQLYNEAVFKLLERKRGIGEAVLFARSATVGGQQFPVHWGGDCWSDFEAMAESLRGGLSLGACGFGFWSHDIGGFEGTPPPDLFKRWIAFGLLSSHSRLHGSHSYRVPWSVDEESSDVLRYFTKLKHRLMPYLYSAAVQAHRTGVPMMRAMRLEFPDDPGCTYLDRQYMLGDSLLVAPVFSPDGVVDYYVPAGTWTSLLTGETVTGPGWFREKHGVFSLPLLVRPNTLLPWGARDDRPDYEFEKDLQLFAYDVREATLELVDQRGKPRLHLRATRSGEELKIEAEGQGTWVLADAPIPYQS